MGYISSHGDVFWTNRFSGEQLSINGGGGGAGTGTATALTIPDGTMAIRITSDANDLQIGLSADSAYGTLKPMMPIRISNATPFVEFGYRSGDIYIHADNGRAATVDVAYFVNTGGPYMVYGGWTWSSRVQFEEITASPGQLTVPDACDAIMMATDDTRTIHPESGTAVGLQVGNSAGADRVTMRYSSGDVFATGTPTLYVAYSVGGA
jgi:hypothetical protein